MSSLQAAAPTLSPEAKAHRDGETNLPFILGSTITSHVLALTAVGLRIYVRSFMVKVLRFDSDYTQLLYSTTAYSLYI
jgi:hypothetical protein